MPDVGLLVDAAREYVIPLLVEAARHTAPYFLSGGAIMTPVLGLSTIVNPPPQTGTFAQRVGHYAVMYALTADETNRLKAVVTDYPLCDVASELKEELRCIMAARKLAATPQLTADKMQRARAAFEGRRVSFVVQDVD